MAYRPFPIYDPKVGYYIAREPWLTPPDAFNVFLNCQIYRGSINKRKGYSLFGERVHQVRGELVGTGDGVTKAFSGTFLHTPIRPGDPSSRFKFTDGTQVITDNGDGTLGGDGSGTIDYETGAYTVTFNTAPQSGTSITVDYQYFPKLPVMGIYQYYDAQGNSSLLVFDTKRCNQFFPLQGKFHDITEADLWTGDEDKYFWCENWQSLLFVTNNHDRIKVFDGTSFSDLNADIDGDGVNNVDTCLLVFGYKGHLILLNTYENGNHYPQRVRWCAAGNWQEWREGYGGGYVDAPTLDWIVAADFLKDSLIVFFERSVWRLLYTGDPNLPFQWEKIADTEGAYAPMSAVTFSDEIIVLGPTALITCDGITADVMGEDRIPDVWLSADQEKYDQSYAAIIEEIREAWWTFFTPDSSGPNRVLSLNYADDTWAVYDLPIKSIGYWSVESSLTWDQVDQSWDELEISWDDRTTQPGYPMTLGGLIDGKIVALNTGNSDLGQPIKMQIVTGRWNPFWKEGRRARLGKVEFLVDSDPDAVITVNFYRNTETLPYKTVSFDCKGNGDKVWKSVFCGEEAEFHRLEIINDQPIVIRIHAIVPYFKPGGLIK